MVSEQEVHYAYRLLLGRVEGDPEVVASHARTAGSLDELRDHFVTSPEFRQLHEFGGFMELSAPPLRVETEASAAQLEAMVRRTEAKWRRFGETEPHFSVLASDVFKADRIGETEEDFYDSGRQFLEELRGTAARCGVDLGHDGRCFELGAGVGRISVWLARQFKTVVAADISKPHLKIAQAAADRFKCPNIECLHVSSIAELVAAAPFDVFVSLIVLQHNPPPVIALLLRTMLGKLRPGGVAFFQVPTYRRNYRFRVKKYLAAPAVDEEFEMHLIPQVTLFRILRESGCEVLACHEDDAAGGNMISNRIFAQKVAAA